MKLIPPDGTVQSLKTVFFLNYFVGKVGRGLEDSETLFAYCLELVHWDDPEGWYGEGGGRRVQGGEHMYADSF